MTLDYALFLDDVRWPKEGQAITNQGLVIKIARSFQAARQLIKQYGFPLYVSFDNDLGPDSLEGWEFANWLINYLVLHERKFPARFDFFVHSSNPVAAENIRGKMNAAIDKIGRYTE